MVTPSYRRRTVLAGAAALGIGVAARAYAAEESVVIAPIRRLTNALLQIMQAGNSTPFQQRFDELAPIIDQTFDLPQILQESVGLVWPSMADDQKQMLAAAFRRYTVASYVNSFDSYDGQRFDIMPETRPVGSDQVVQTKIIPRSGSGHELDYVMRQAGGGWRVVDVLADGSISRVAVQRSDFRHLLTRGGPQALAESLRTKSSNLSEGAG